MISFEEIDEYTPCPWDVYWNLAGFHCILASSARFRQ